MTRETQNTAAETAVADSELLSLLIDARSGGDAAFSELVKRYSPLISSLVYSFSRGMCDSDRDEVNQEALLAFSSAVRSYDPLYGNVTFGLYAKNCITNRLISAVSRRREGPEIVPLPEYDAFLVADDPGKAAADRESLAELRKLIRSSLSDYENDVWWSYYDGVPIGKIAEKTGKTRKSVENAVYRIKTKLRRILRGK